MTRVTVRQPSDRPIAAPRLAEATNLTRSGISEKEKVFHIRDKKSHGAPEIGFHLTGRLTPIEGIGSLSYGHHITRLARPEAHNFPVYAIITVPRHDPILKWILDFPLLFMLLSYRWFTSWINYHVYGKMCKVERCDVSNWECATRQTVQLVI